MRRDDLLLAHDPAKNNAPFGACGDDGTAGKAAAMKTEVHVRWLSAANVHLPLADDAIEVLIPGDGAAFTADHANSDGHERKTFVRAPLVSVIPPRDPCRLNGGRQAGTLVLAIAPEFFARQARAALGNATAPRLVARYAALDPFLREIGNELLDELHGGRSPNHAFLLPFAGVVCVHLARHYCEEPSNVAPSGGLTEHQLRQVQAFVRTHLAEPLRVHQLAAQARLSQFHFARMFKRATGQPPHLYVLLQRVEYAKSLLRDGDMALVDVAAQAGFRTQGHFTGVFRRYTGSTPRAFRLASAS